MAKVDSKGRIVLPKELRDRLGIEAGTEVEVRADDGRAVIEPEREPDEIVDRLEALVEDAATDRSATEGSDIEDPYARDHAETIRRGVDRETGNDE
ncbi:AbrB/MazE/SpoVT family DNA-binding domain-containing protein [Halosimplex rubrum]|uniref:AbrB/MazE/SpoVT family DNA-binding domain-containing protein n=1 Tax=Halosimplex rubrum TaxID=869889 RepID=A0A7D5T141_9EURY|nr:AbrB/MazE/SpoVT family DNA-binding domain-containing protein [Halosimplex rubrum]QLH78548.1 AbrB/MazE/SpoVT family DNA-binding domain-containing protein [Halosimplex rubrum]